MKSPGAALAMAKSRRSTRQKADVQLGNAAPMTTTSKFLSLPLEIRLEICSYIIPRSVKLPPGRGVDYVWHRGNIDILAVNKQIHDEVAQAIYGDATFNLQVKHGVAIFQYHYYSPLSGVFVQESVVPRESSGYIPYMRNLHVQLIPTSKYYRDFSRSTSRYGPPKASNFPIDKGWPRQRSLTTHDGAETMVKVMDEKMDLLLANLTQALRIQHLHMHVGQWHLGRCDVEFDKLYLTPLLHLRNVSEITFGGDVSREFQDEVSKLFEDRKKSSPEGSMGVKSHSN